RTLRGWWSAASARGGHSPRSAGTARPAPTTKGKLSQGNSLDGGAGERREKRVRRPTQCSVRSSTPERLGGVVRPVFLQPSELVRDDAGGSPGAAPGRPTSFSRRSRNGAARAAPRERP